MVLLPFFLAFYVVRLVCAVLLSFIIEQLDTVMHG